MAYYNQPQGGQGEGFDGRMLFHQRRDMIHQEIIKWSTLAVKDPKYIGEWVACLMSLHRILWASINKIVFPIDNKEVNFNLYMQKKIEILNKKIMNSFQYIERANGEVYIKTNREKLKKLYTHVDKAQKQLALVEYQKNLDLPKIHDAVEDCTTGGM